jgi:putative nucleic acid modification protein with dual OB domain
MVSVLIVAKTHMGKDTACVGALNLETNEGIRLLGSNGSKQPKDTKFDIGQIWEIEYIPPQKIVLPHTEDVMVQRSHYLGQQSHLRDFLMERVQPCFGGVDQLFDGLLISEKGGCFLSSYVPEQFLKRSTAFWLPEFQLRQGTNPQYYIIHVDTEPYRYEEIGFHDEDAYIKYVGFSPSIRQIPSRTLVRVSLARWWDGDGHHEKRCYLQLSGWYL